MANNELKIAGRRFRLAKHTATEDLQLLSAVSGLFGPLLSEMTGAADDKMKAAGLAIKLLSHNDAPRVLRMIAESAEVMVRGRWEQVDLDVHFTGKLGELMQVVVWVFQTKLAPNIKEGAA